MKTFYLWFILVLFITSCSENRDNEFNEVEKLIEYLRDNNNERNLIKVCFEFSAKTNKIIGISIFDFEKDTFNYDFSNLKYLERLIIESTELTTFLPNFHPNIKRIGLSNNVLTKIPLLDNYPNLESFSASNNMLKGNIIWPYDNIKHLNLSNNYIDSIYFKDNCLIENLNLRQNRLAQFNSTLNYLSNLKFIDLRGNSIESIDISKLHELKTIKISPHVYMDDINIQFIENNNIILVRN